MSNKTLWTVAGALGAYWFLFKREGAPFGEPPGEPPAEPPLSVQRTRDAISDLYAQTEALAPLIQEQLRLYDGSAAKVTGSSPPYDACPIGSDVTGGVAFSVPVLCRRGRTGRLEDNPTAYFLPPSLPEGNASRLWPGVQMGAVPFFDTRALPPWEDVVVSGRPELRILLSPPAVEGSLTLGSLYGSLVCVFDSSTGSVIEDFRNLKFTTNGRWSPAVQRVYLAQRGRTTAPNNMYVQMASDLGQGWQRVADGADWPSYRVDYLNNCAYFAPPGVRSVTVGRNNDGGLSPAWRGSNSLSTLSSGLSAASRGESALETIQRNLSRRTSVPSLNRNFT